MDALVTHIPLRTRDGSLAAFACVDTADIEWLSQWTWRRHTTGYVFRGEQVDRKYVAFMLHRELLGLKVGDPLTGDHVNRNKLDNRRSNLRLATRAQNNQNVPSRSGSTSRFRGVCWDRTRGLWKAFGRADGRLTNIGHFESETDAAEAAAAFRAAHMPYAREEVA